VAAASKAVGELGLRGLSVDAVLDEAGLSTRAFYRHFESKDQLVAAVFVEMARVEALRLRRKMANTAGPVEAVAATAGALGAALVAVLLPTGCGVGSSPVVAPPATSAPISVPSSVPGG
jgi:AcrR family transcriptional regulator